MPDDKLTEDQRWIAEHARTALDEWRQDVAGGGPGPSVRERHMVECLRSLLRGVVDEIAPKGSSDG